MSRRRLVMPASAAAARTFGLRVHTLFAVRARRQASKRENPAVAGLSVVGQAGFEQRPMDYKSGHPRTEERGRRAGRAGRGTGHPRNPCRPERAVRSQHPTPGGRGGSVPRAVDFSFYARLTDLHLTKSPSGVPVAHRFHRTEGLLPQPNGCEGLVVPVVVRYLLLVTVHCLVAGVVSTPPGTAERTLNVCWPTGRLL